MDGTSVIVGVILGILAIVAIILALRGRLNTLFLTLSALILLLVGIAVIRDTQARDYVAIQQTYAARYGSNSPTSHEPFNVGIQQLFPSFAGSFEGDVYKIERCISCHVPNISELSPQQAAERIACDFFLDQPYAQAEQIAKEFGFKSTYDPSTGQCVSQHPTMIVPTAKDCPAGNVCIAYDQAGPNGGVVNPTTGQTILSGGFLSTNVDPSSTANQGLSGQITLQVSGCIVCHNGNRLALTEQTAHQNLVDNPVYSWQQGAELYAADCAVCHGNAGQGGIGPPLNDQNELGFYNEDFYYRCIEYGMTGFEHYGSVMPNWGSIAPGYSEAAHPPGAGAHINPTRVLSEAQIQTLVQFIRHWEQYDTLP
jgi:mono/diheme cytochrome c family protein